MKKFAALCMALCMTAMLTACGDSAQGEAPAADNGAAQTEGTEAGAETEAAAGDAIPNTVNSLDDLPGKTIGVQLGTTGDIFASD